MNISNTTSSPPLFQALSGRRHRYYPNRPANFCLAIDFYKMKIRGSIESVNAPLSNLTPPLPRGPISPSSWILPPPHSYAVIIPPPFRKLSPVLSIRAVSVSVHSHPTSRALPPHRLFTGAAEVGMNKGKPPLARGQTHLLRVLAFRLFFMEGVFGSNETSSGLEKDFFASCSTSSSQSRFSWRPARDLPMNWFARS